ncbi:MAG TPA: phage tail assembly chaperone [Hyphomicrobiaceae bacterium]|nr:phage tail assembly chaperone [Hyphomicrobiaceae bacterium]
MAAGLGMLRLPPRDFWSATPRELAAAIRGLTGQAAPAPPPDRAALATLMHRYPD